jgi:hypothetical protein
VPNLLSPAAEPDLLPVPLGEPGTPVSELCEEVPERLLPGEVEPPVELSEPLEPDIPEDAELTPSCCAVSESTLPVTFRLFDF